MLHWDTNQQTEMRMGALLSKKQIANANIRNVAKKSIWDFFKIDIERRTRKREVVEARYMYYEICRMRRMSLNEIGQSVGKDHATVLHGTKRFSLLNCTTASVLFCNNPSCKSLGSDIISPNHHQPTCIGNFRFIFSRKGNAPIFSGQRHTSCWLFNGNFCKKLSCL